jgi:hypothetical protein
MGGVSLYIIIDIIITSVGLIYNSTISMLFIIYWTLLIST